MERKHVLLKQDEITQALVASLLRKEGIEPESVEASSMVFYRIVDGSLFVSIVIDRVTPVKIGDGQ